MKLRSMAVLAGVGAPLIMTSASQAGFEGLTGSFKANAEGILVCNIYACFNNLGDHFNAAFGNSVNQLTINVVKNGEGKGNFYQDPNGTDTAPSPNLFGVFPALRYDTFVTVGVKSFNANSPGDPEGQLANNITLTPTWPGFSQQQLRLTGDAWAVLPDAPQGDPFNPSNGDGGDVFPGNGKVLIAQLATKKGLGFTGVINVQVISDGSVVQVKVPFSHVVPTPGALGLLGAAGLIGVRRRRRQTTR